MPPTPSQRPIDVVVVENLDVVRQGLKSLPLTHPAAIASVKTYAAMDEVDLAASAPRVVVLDYWLGRDDTPSLDHVATLHEWGAFVLLYTTEETPYLLQSAMRAGIDGLCLKNDGMDALVEAITTVGLGETVLASPVARALIKDDALKAALTPVEIEVLRALAYGKTPAQIAAIRQVSENTISTHVEHIRAKYSDSTGGKVNRARMLREGLRDGYVDRRQVNEDPENT